MMASAIGLSLYAIDKRPASCSCTSGKPCSPVESLIRVAHRRSRLYVCGKHQMMVQMHASQLRSTIDGCANTSFTHAPAADMSSELSFMDRTVRSVFHS